MRSKEGTLLIVKGTLPARNWSSGVAQGWIIMFHLRKFLQEVQRFDHHHILMFIN